MGLFREPKKGKSLGETSFREEKCPKWKISMNPAQHEISRYMHTLT